MKHHRILLAAIPLAIAAALIWILTSGGGDRLVVYALNPRPGGEAYVRIESRLRTSAAESNIVEILALMAAPPDGKALSPFAEGLALRSSSVDGDILTLDFNSRYSHLQTGDMLRSDYCIAATMTGLDGIRGVVITVVNRPHPIFGSEVITPSLFAPSPGDFDPVSARVTLYTVNPERNGFKTVTRQIVVSGSMSLAGWVAGELVSPSKGDIVPIFPEGTAVSDLYLRDGQCFLRLTHEALNSGEGLPPLWLSVYSLVNSLCLLDGIDSVTIDCDGGDFLLPDGSPAAGLTFDGEPG